MHYSQLLKPGLILVSALICLTAHAESGDDRHFNVRAFPVGMIFGEYLVDASFAPLGFLSVGVLGYHANVDILEQTAKGTGIGGRATIHFAGDRFEDSWILSGYYYKTGRVDFTGTSLGGEPTSGSATDIYEAGLVTGKMWTWKSGFNITFAGGLRVIDSTQDRLVMRNSAGQMRSDSVLAAGGLRLELALGWAF